MRNHLKTGLVLFLSLSMRAGFAQCSAPAVNSPNCAIGNYSSGSNCHGFAMEYLEENYNLGYVDCYNPTSSDLSAINDCATAGFSMFNSLAGLLELTTQGASDVAIITYEQNFSGSWVVHHSAVDLKYNGYFLSKWESCGPVVRHYATTIGLPYYQSQNNNFRIQYWRKKVTQPQPCTTPSLTLSACTSCSCATSQGYFLVSGSSSGWTNHSWSVSGAGIAWNMGSYIYVNKPGGGYVGVTLTATYTACNETKSKYQSFYFPYCSGGGYYYQMSGGPDVTLDANQRTLRVVLPEEFTEGVRVGEGSELTVQLYRLDGRLISEQSVSAEQPVLDLEVVPESGIYIVNVLQQGHRILSRKLAIR